MFSVTMCRSSPKRMVALTASWSSLLVTTSTRPWDESILCVNLCKPLNISHQMLQCNRPSHLEEPTGDEGRQYKRQVVVHKIRPAGEDKETYRVIASPLPLSNSGLSYFTSSRTWSGPGVEGWLWPLQRQTRPTVSRCLGTELGLRATRRKRSTASVFTQYNYTLKRSSEVSFRRKRQRLY